MIIARIECATRTVGKSQGYLGLPLRDEVTPEGLPIMVTAWEPTPDELERLKAGALVYLRVAGKMHPPVLIEVGEAPK